MNQAFSPGQVYRGTGYSTTGSYNLRDLRCVIVWITSLSKPYIDAICIYSDNGQVEKRTFQPASPFANRLQLVRDLNG